MTMLGTVERDEVLRRLSRAAIPVLPSRYEALPMSLLEAMAHGCAVVATPVRQVEELVDGCGVLLPASAPRVANGSKSVTPSPPSPCCSSASGGPRSAAAGAVRARS